MTIHIEPNVLFIAILLVALVKSVVLAWMNRANRPAIIFWGLIALVETFLLVAQLAEVAGAL